MNILNTICSYWYECIKNEDVLEKDISINVRSRAVLYPFDYDPFIFNIKDTSIKIENERLRNFASAKAEGLDFFYGYPLLYYQDEKTKKQLVAPLFIIKVIFTRKNSNLYLSKDDPYPVCGIQALSKLGLRTEEIADINQSIENIFKRAKKINSLKIATNALEIISSEAEIIFNEKINPLKLTNSKKITKQMKIGLYNKSMIFAGETTVFNVHLIKDLLELKNREDLERTALSFLVGHAKTDEDDEVTPILPFPSNEYQLAAIRGIFNHPLSVITGPPGTGKSQFISNLIVNLFLAGKSVLFVSHTGEAVNVVNSRINDHFKNLMLRTGNKELRQSLKGKYNELVAEYSKKRSGVVNENSIHLMWKTIIDYRNSLLEKDKLEQCFQKEYFANNEIKNILSIQNSIFKKIKIYFKLLFSSFRLNNSRRKIRALPERIDLERKIRELETKYYQSCQDYVSVVYLEMIMGNDTLTGSVNTFLNQATSYRLYQDEENNLTSLNALRVLKVWSSTLKSLRATFPLQPCIFDYVIFDEASQVDLPSAAPALYRAKKAIVVGDPMQLTHIAGITKEIDHGLAKIHGLTEEENLYPSKTRYCDVSLYKAAENSLAHSPILLTNHYRSEDQIIALCNQVFYGGQLKILSTLDHSKYPQSLSIGVQWEDVEGEARKLPSGSRVNLQEVKVVIKIFKEIWEKVKDSDLTVGVVTPYNGQKNALFKNIQQFVEPEVFEGRIRVLTAHQFQGSEADIIIFSLVVSSRGNGNSDRWYNIYPQILNVALSRARFLLYIVGDKEFCSDRQGVLGKIEEVYEKIKDEEELEKQDLHVKFDTPIERLFYKELQKVKFKKYGYRLFPKFVAKRYTLDFALIGDKKIDIEIDGIQHEIIEGMPVLEDIERDNFLREKEGWKIIRFPNYRILSEMPSVIDELLEEVGSAKS